MIYYIADGGRFTYKAPANQWSQFRSAARIDAVFGARLQVVVQLNGRELDSFSVAVDDIENFYKTKLQFSFEVTEPSDVRILVQQAEWDHFQVL